MFRHSLVVVVSLLFFASAAAAQDAARQPQTGWYGTLSGNWLVPRDYDGDGQEWKTYNGYGVYGALGHRLSDTWRAEAEVGYGTVENDRISVGIPVPKSMAISTITRRPARCIMTRPPSSPCIPISAAVQAWCISATNAAPSPSAVAAFRRAVAPPT